MLIYVELGELDSDPGVETAGVEFAEASGAGLFRELSQFNTSITLVKGKYHFNSRFSHGRPGLCQKGQFGHPCEQLHKELSLKGLRNFDPGGTLPFFQIALPLELEKNCLTSHSPLRDINNDR